MDREDLTQQIRIKIMHALREKSIQSLHAYLRSVTHNEYVSHLRRLKPVLPLSSIEEGEIQGYSENWITLRSRESGDPQVAFEQSCNFYERLEMLVLAIMALPMVQRRVAVCVLRDRIDDPFLLAQAFRRYNLDISTLQWPKDSKAKQ